MTTELKLDNCVIRILIINDKASTGVSGGPPISPFSSVKLSFANSNFILHFVNFYLLF